MGGLGDGREAGLGQAERARDAQGEVVPAEPLGPAGVEPAGRASSVRQALSPVSTRSVESATRRMPCAWLRRARNALAATLLRRARPGSASQASTSARAALWTMASGRARSTARAREAGARR